MQNLILAVVMALPVVTSTPRPAPPAPAVEPTATQPAQAAAVRQYLIRIRLLEKSDTAQDKIIAAPVLVTCEGRPAKFQVGGEVPAPDHSGIGVVPFGLSSECTIRRNDQGQLFLDATLVADRTRTATQDRVVVTGSRVRIVERITLGKRQTLSLKKTDATRIRLEWTVERVDAHH